MTRLASVTVVGSLLLGAMALAEPALAQTPAVSDANAGIDFVPIISALINALVPVIAGVATYLINARIKNQQMATLLSNAVQNGLGVVQQQTTTALRGAAPTVSTGRPHMDAGVQYVLDNAAEAIKHFKIPPDRIAQKLEAKLGLAAIATNLATTTSPAPVIHGPLAPVPMVGTEVINPG